MEPTFEGKKNFVLIGEAGSGKTALALQLAAVLREKGRQVHLFDMDQTKPLFRAQDAAGEMEAAGVHLHAAPQMMDAPTLPSGVAECLADPEKTVLLDVGGGAFGSHMIGQFSARLHGEDCEVLYLVNPYRPWSRSREQIDETARRVLGASGLAVTGLVANPNLGAETDLSVIQEGMNRLHSLLPEREFRFLCIREDLARMWKEEPELPRFVLRQGRLLSGKNSPEMRTRL